MGRPARAVGHGANGRARHEVISLARVSLEPTPRGPPQVEPSAMAPAVGRGMSCSRLPRYGPCGPSCRLRRRRSGAARGDLICPRRARADSPHLARVELALYGRDGQMRHEVLAPARFERERTDTPRAGRAGTRGLCGRSWHEVIAPARVEREPTCCSSRGSSWRSRARWSRTPHAVSGLELAHAGALGHDDCAAKAPILLGDLAQRRAQLANESQTRNSAKNSFPL